MKSIDLEQEKAEKRVYDKAMKKQASIQNEFGFLMDCDRRKVQSEFIRAQAKEICKYLYRLKFTPFRSWEAKIKELIDDEDEDFLYSFYIIANEFGELIPDEERILALVLTDPDPEEFPDSRL